ncbi:MAG: hypothetical protein FWE23_03715 [Chitinivibrionia bacterium]|nr:hypothetical protein [Chitinivibrionia bacterium]
MEKNIVRERKNLQNKPYLSNTLIGMVPKTTNEKRLKASLRSDEFGNLLIPKNIWTSIIKNNGKSVEIFADNVFISIKREVNVNPLERKKKLKGEKYLEDFYKKNISEIWNDFENGKIRLNSEEVDWGKPVGNEVW